MRMTEQLVIRLNKTEKQQLREQAQTLGVSLSSVVRLRLNGYLK